MDPGFGGPIPSPTSPSGFGGGGGNYGPPPGAFGGPEQGSPGSGGFPPPQGGLGAPPAGLPSYGGAPAFGGPPQGGFTPPGQGGQGGGGYGGPPGPQDFGGQAPPQGFNPSGDGGQPPFNPYGQQQQYGQPQQPYDPQQQQPPYGQQQYPNQALAPMGAYPQGGPLVPAPQAQSGQHGPKGQIKNPNTELVLGLVTCGIYQLIWFIRVSGEMSAFLQRDEPSWPKLMGLGLITCGFYSLYWQLVRLGALVQEIQYRAGVQNPQNHGWMYLIPYYNVILLQQELNRAWQGPA